MKSSKYNNVLFDPDHMTKVPDGQRALVLQGGGSLGAYEAGARHYMRDSLKQTEKKETVNLS